MKIIARSWGDSRVLEADIHVRPVHGILFRGVPFSWQAKRSNIPCVLFWNDFKYVSGCVVLGPRRHVTPLARLSMCQPLKDFRMHQGASSRMPRLPYFAFIRRIARGKEVAASEAWF